jgi:hypothetical protein
LLSACGPNCFQRAGFQLAWNLLFVIVRQRGLIIGKFGVVSEINLLKDRGTVEASGVDEWTGLIIWIIMIIMIGERDDL